MAFWRSRKLCRGTRSSKAATREQGGWSNVFSVMERRYTCMNLWLQAAMPLKKTQFWTGTTHWKHTYYLSLITPILQQSHTAAGNFCYVQCVSSSHFVHYPTAYRALSSSTVLFPTTHWSSLSDQSRWPLLQEKCIAGKTLWSELTFWGQQQQLQKCLHPLCLHA